MSEWYPFDTAPKDGVFQIWTGDTVRNATFIGGRLYLLLGCHEFRDWQTHLDRAAWKWIHLPDPPNG